MRIGQLGLHEQLKVRMQDDLFVAQFHDAFIAALDRVPGYDRGDNSVDRLAHVFNENGLAIVEGNLENLQHFRRAHARELESITPFFVLDPDNTLELWVDDQ